MPNGINGLSENTPNFDSSEHAAKDGLDLNLSNEVDEDIKKKLTSICTALSGKSFGVEANTELLNILARHLKEINNPEVARNVISKIMGDQERFETDVIELAEKMLTPLLPETITKKLQALGLKSTESPVESEYGNKETNDQMPQAPDVGDDLNDILINNVVSHKEHTETFSPKVDQTSVKTARNLKGSFVKPKNPIFDKIRRGVFKIKDRTDVHLTSLKLLKNRNAATMSSIERIKKSENYVMTLERAMKQMKKLVNAVIRNPELWERNSLRRKELTMQLQACAISINFAKQGVEKNPEFAKREKNLLVRAQSILDMAYDQIPGLSHEGENN